ncbi:MAG: integrase core domain-containing protein [Thermoleophilia bacterium]|jgi:putative transposase
MSLTLTAEETAGGIWSPSSTAVTVRSWDMSSHFGDGPKRQNGVIERFFRSPKEECVWQHNFRSFAEVRQHVRSRIDHYNEERPHQSLGYLSPRQHRERQHVQLVA